MIYYSSSLTNKIGIIVIKSTIDQLLRKNKNLPIKKYKKPMLNTIKSQAIFCYIKWYYETSEAIYTFHTYHRIGRKYKYHTRSQT